ncbi:type IV toxin-antitoxin system AbiEi family antitoxin domain-containing protein [Corynebacterium comes]|uniref:Uncharacterized protein n=1 Tax=Corynebacterium comes TaxID=2675218 RepID=A0A6B8W5K7_9CORY|nr:type IV toxin-antitoxin system AbiEi family antitoxin domain-containing protein [Corynebacterium comes]QGU05200.1 hypothetical protein CETAM_09755 [Corynebacterium comes]
MGEILTTADLRARGVHAKKIQALIRDGKLHRVDRGVYTTSRPQGELLLRALQQARPHIVFTGRTAWELRGNRSVYLPAAALVARDGYLRGSGYLRLIRGKSATTELRNGIRIADPLRTAMDMPATKQFEAVKFLEGQYGGKDGSARLKEDLAAYARVPAGMRALVGKAAVGGDSETERVLFRVLREQGIVMEQNKKIGHYRRDGVHEKSKVIVEVNGYEFHRDRGVMVKDCWKANDALIRGYTHLSYSDSCIDMHLAEVVAEIEGVINGRARPSGPVWGWHRMFEEP